jgi:hypothetical protein
VSGPIGPDDLKRRGPTEWQAECDLVERRFRERDLSIYPERFQQEERAHHQRRIEHMRSIERHFSGERRPKKIRNYPGWITRKLLGL